MVGRSDPFTPLHALEAFVRTPVSATLVLLLTVTVAGCSTDTEPSATAACEEYAAYVDANKAKESGTAEILERALSLSAAAAEADATYEPLAAGVESRRQAGEELRTAVEGDTSDGDAVDAAIAQITSANEAVAAACEPLGVTVDYAR